MREVEDDAREALLVRQGEEDVEIALLLPRRLLAQDSAEDDADADALLQAFEGVSHFVYVAERVRTGLPTTRLELELQAEVDKFVLLALDRDRVDAATRVELCAHLFERVRFLHRAGSEDGDRYRLANSLAARYVRRLSPPSSEPRSLCPELRRFYRAGQTEKIWRARAA